MEESANQEREWDAISQRANTDLLNNQNKLTVIGSTNYHIKQDITIYLGEVLPHSRHGS